MPRGYSIIVGVPNVDVEAPFYSRNFPGFDGRAGCEGVGKDIRRMEALAHYFGYQPVMGGALVGPKATVANVFAAIESLAKPEIGLDHGDHVLVYLSCHGKYLGNYQGDSSPSANLGNALTAFLLHDGPFFNTTLFLKLRELQIKSRRARLRICTVIDACHAGSGQSIPPGLVRELWRDLHEMLIDRAIFQSAVVAQKKGAVELMQRLAGKTDLFSDLLLDPNSIKISLEVAIILLRVILNMLTGLSWQIAHLGAAGDELRAEGGPTGSLFTRLLDLAIRMADRPYTYREMHDVLAQWLPLNRRPVLERLGQFATGTHFADRSTVFDIEE